MKKIKLSEWATLQGIHYQTAFRWYKSGKMPQRCEATPTGSIFVVMDEPELTAENHVVVYCRVSSQSRRNELQYQVQRCLDFAASKGLQVTKVYKEVASGMNDSRRELWKMLDGKPSIIIVENKDRLTRFGFSYLERLLKRLGYTVLVINSDINDEQDLVRDLVSVMTSFCCRLYGLRRSKNKMAAIKEVIEYRD